ncbi:RING-H2 finger protein [Melia azedarach]|uniref:RING-H2 finger protein n=1 Tax=Melia azedarach TaxID=155640 RepID=A0ACC1XK09_MELAZ|nr:RING-H2 finger protein [Melia azedarach]
MALHNVALKMASGLSVKSIAIQLIKCFKLMTMMALHHLGGLLKTSDQRHEDNINYSPDHLDLNPTSYVVVTDGPYPSIITVSADVVTSMIKKTLPVVEYGKFLERVVGGDHVVGHSVSVSVAVCTVCLECIEKSQEIRELGNCSHVFHRECLDRWVDESQITCPLCRSMLLPVKGNGMILR